MTKDTNKARPSELAGALNMMMYPAGLMAGGAALGIGLASQVVGMWAGTFAAAIDASMRALDDHKPAWQPGSAPSARTRAAVDTLIADAESTAREVVKAAGDVAEKVKRPVARRSAPKAAPSEVASAPKSVSKPARPDDLKRISGIGPKLEEVLNGLGVWTFGQIAAWTSAEIDWIEDYLAFKGRVARDGWIEQAATLGARRKGGK